MSGLRLSATAVLTGAAVLLASGIAGFLFAGHSESSLRLAPAPVRGAAPAHSAGASAVASPRESAVAPAGAERTIPDHLPDFSLPGLDGAPHRLSDWKGRPLLVNFWATWCEPCRQEIPLLKSIRHEHAQDGLEIVGIAVDYRDSVEKFARQLGIDYPVLIGDKGGLAAVQAFGMDTVLPFSVFADREGRIVTLKVGELHRDETDFILGRLNALDQGRVSLAAVREEIGARMRRLAALREESSAAAAK